MQEFNFTPIHKIELEILSDSGLKAGSITGDYKFDNQYFTINKIQIYPDYLSLNLVRSALCEIINESGANNIRWFYDEPDGENYDDESRDPQLKIFRSIAMFYPDFTIKRTLLQTLYTITFKDMHEKMRHDVIYSDEELARRGMKFFTFEKLPDFAGEIQELCDSDMDAETFSPFKAGNYTPELSHIAVLNGEVFGWIYCKKINSDAVTIQGLYIPKKFRTVMGGGTSLTAYTIRKLIADFSVLKFNISEQNKSFKRFYHYYFGNALKTGPRRFKIEMIRNLEK